MKKSIIVILALLGLSLSAHVFAAGPVALDPTGGKTETGRGPQIFGSTTPAATTGGSSLGSLSRGISFGVMYDKNSYALTTVHKGGTKEFGTAHNATAIYSKAKAAVFSAPSKLDYTAFAEGWTVQ